MSKTPTSTLARAQKGGGTKLHNTLVYLRQHWQLYAFFIMPAFLLTVIFRYRSEERRVGKECRL